jgi:hypothetical protein
MDHAKISAAARVQFATTMVAVLLAIAGAALFSWAWAEERFLRKPDPEPPPSIFKE